MEGRALRQPTLSVVMPVGSSPERPRKLLEILRPVADEVIVSADSKVKDEVIAGLADLADRILVHDLDGGSPCSAFPWLQHQARGDWVLQMEDDMVPGVKLLEALPEMIRDRWLSSFVIRRRWLWKDTGHYLGGFPWATDWAGRMLRNVPGLWTNDGSLHTRPEVLGEYRLVEDELYHLTFLLEDQASREAKAERYEEFDQVFFDEYNVNDLYFPERLDRLEVREVPPEDRELLDFVVDAGDIDMATIEANRAVEPEQVAGRAELSKFFFAKPAPTDLSTREAGIEFLDPRDEVTFGGDRLFMLRFTNLGEETLSAGTHPAAAAVATRWLDEAGRPYPIEPTVSVLHETVPPGGRSQLGVMTPPPTVSGDFILEAVPVIFGSGSIGEPVHTKVAVRSPEDGRAGLVMLGNRQLRFDNEKLARDLSEERDRREAAERRLGSRAHRLVERIGGIMRPRRRDRGG